MNLAGCAVELAETNPRKALYEVDLALHLEGTGRVQQRVMECFITCANTLAKTDLPEVISRVSGTILNQTNNNNRSVAEALTPVWKGFVLELTKQNPPAAREFATKAAEGDNTLLKQAGAEIIETLPDRRGGNYHGQPSSTYSPGG